MAIPSKLSTAKDCRNILTAKFRLGVEEWAVRVILGMYSIVRISMRVNGQYSEEFGVGVGVHQGFVITRPWSPGNQWISYTMGYADTTTHTILYTPSVWRPYSGRFG